MSSLVSDEQPRNGGLQARYLPCVEFINEPHRTTMILAGDVGGTKCSLGLFAKNGPSLRSVFQSRLATRDYSGFEDLIGDFLERAAGPNRSARGQKIEAAGFGLAGVVVDGSLHAGNLPWVLNGSALAQKLHLDKVVLLNDLTATALSLDRLGPNDFAILNQGTPEQNATKAVIAAGTGLGEAILFWDGQRYRVAPSEGGQADFAPRNRTRDSTTHPSEQAVAPRVVRGDYFRPGLPQDSRISGSFIAPPVFRFAGKGCGQRNYGARIDAILSSLRRDHSVVD